MRLIAYVYKFYNAVSRQARKFPAYVISIFIIYKEKNSVFSLSKSQELK